MDKWKYKFQRFMMGRNGSDDLCRFFLGLALITLFISFFVWKTALLGVAVAFLIYSYFRVFSKNLTKRYQENLAYKKLRNKATAPFKRMWLRVKEWRAYHTTHHIYTCPNCRQIVRVPKGKGKIKVTCPKCRKQFVKKS